jgi:hypothetical protein
LYIEAVTFIVQRGDKLLKKSRRVLRSERYTHGSKVFPYKIQYFIGPN